VIPDQEQHVIHHGSNTVYGHLEQYIDPIVGPTNSFIFEYQPGQGGTAALCYTEFPPPTTAPAEPGNVPASTGQSQIGQASGTRQ
jgi:hypothetical protein